MTQFGLDAWICVCQENYSLLVRSNGLSINQVFTWDFRELNFPVLYSSFEDLQKSEVFAKSEHVVLNVEFVDKQQILTSMLAAYTGDVNTRLNFRILGIYDKFNFREGVA